MAQPQDIMQLLDELQFGASPENTNNAPSSFTRRPPGTDPRAKAIQQYMEMQGANRVPSFGAPQEMAYGGKKRRMSKDSVDSMRSDMRDEADQNYDSRSADDYFRDDSQAYHPERLPSKLRAEMDKPNYTNNNGRPSPYKDDETIQNDITNRIGKNKVSVERLREPLDKPDFWGDDYQLTDPSRPPFDPDKQNGMLNPGEKERTDEELLDAIDYYTRRKSFDI